MNELILKEYSEEQIRYEYYPEQDGKPGEIIYNPKTKETTILRKAENDETGRYGYNATRKIIEYVDKKYLPMTAIQAWV